MKAALTLAGSLALATALPSAAHADQWQDWARVTHVEPVHDTRTVRTPVETCREVAVRDRGQRRDYNRRQGDFHPGAALVGGLIGGAIGHQFGGGNGKKALTAAGALLGASIATSAANQPRRQPARRLVCDTTWEVDRVQELVGYDVTYRYRGRDFTRRMDQHPGSRVPVQVDVQPVLDTDWEDDDDRYHI